MTFGLYLMQQVNKSLNKAEWTQDKRTFVVTFRSCSPLSGSILTSVTVISGQFSRGKKWCMFSTHNGFALQAQLEHWYRWCVVTRLIHTQHIWCTMNVLSLSKMSLASEDETVNGVMNVH